MFANNNISYHSAYCCLSLKHLALPLKTCVPSNKLVVLSKSQFLIL